MPRSHQTTKKSKRKEAAQKAQKPTKTITKKPSKPATAKKKAAAPPKKVTLSKTADRKRQRARLKRAENMAKKIQFYCASNTVLAALPMMRLCREVTHQFVGRRVRMQAKAMVDVHNSIESLIDSLLRTAAGYIPKNQQTLAVSHIQRALELPHYKEAFRVVDGRMKTKKAVKASS